MLFDLLNKIDKNKISIKSLLTKTYGLGLNRSNKLCSLNGISPNIKLKDLDTEQIETLDIKLQTMDFMLGQELKKYRAKQFDRLVKIKSYKGIRKLKGYPVRGQRTHSNSNTSKKKRYF